MNNEHEATETAELMAAGILTIALSIFVIMYMVDFMPLWPSVLVHIVTCLLAFDFMRRLECLKWLTKQNDKARLYLAGILSVFGVVSILLYGPLRGIKRKIA